MRKKGNQSISSGDDSINLQALGDINISFEGDFPIHLIDERIEKEVEKLRKSRFFREFKRSEAPLMLGRRLIDGGLSRGSDKLRCWGLAWCARLLTSSDKLSEAEKLLDHSKTLGECPEITIAEAFIFSRKGDKSTALQTLASLNSAASRTAALMIVAYHDSAEGAIQWMNDTSYGAEDLDSDGKSYFLTRQLELSRWDDAKNTIDILNDYDFTETPVLYHLTGVTKLIAAVPTEFRSVVLNQVPFEAKSFRLASDAAAVEARKVAYLFFINARDVAKQLDFRIASKIDDEYALWLELKDPTQLDSGLNRLEYKLGDPDSRLSVVHLALQFGIKLDLDAVERDIERHVAQNGGMTQDAAIARYALAFTKPTPEEVANYLAVHQNQLAAHIDKDLLQFRQIEMLSRAGFIDRAQSLLDQAIERGITPAQESNLRRSIAEAQGNDPIESYKELYKSTNNLGDLINLVNELENHQRWEDLSEYGRKLFEETHSLRDAERLVYSYNNTHRFKVLVEFLKSNPDLMSQSRNLQMSYAWGLYNEGAFIESRKMLAELSDDTESQNYRTLRLNLGISMGDWPTLSAYVANEYQNRNDRNAHDLISAAQLALHIGSPHARDLVFESAAKAGDDASILAGAYFIATSAGWENDSQVFQWLERAARLSGDDGPLQRMSIKDILERKPEWDSRESEIWRLLGRGEMPIFLAAQSLNRTLIDLTTFPVLANLSEPDPRRRSSIPAYSGKRIPQQFEVNGKTVALDATALLTLSFLKILDKTLDTFEKVYIPHSTLMWLFEERQKAVFHQPSRIRNAHEVQDLLATDMLEKFTPSTIVSSDLSAQIGDELTALIAEAEKLREDDDSQHIVVRSSPVHRVSSLMEEEADLSAHAAVLSSCIAIVDKLKEKGQITVSEEKRARSYLQIHEKPWPNQPKISDGATLYLDDLTITYLLHLGLLEKLKAAGLNAVASPRAISEMNTLISYEHISSEVMAIIERIRVSLNSRIESGKIHVGSNCYFSEIKEKTILQHTTAGVIALAPHCDAVIVDDRFMNQHTNIDCGDRLTPVFSTLDLLESLVAADVISNDELLEYRTRLRRGGYFFVPVSSDELELCLKASYVVDGDVIETAELKAIREYILRVRMSDWLLLPNEAPWLDGMLKTIIRVLRGLWHDNADISDTIARSNWLAELYDIRGWAHRLIPVNADNVIHIGRGAQILMLLMRPHDVQEHIVDAYWQWVEDRILFPIKEQFPELYIWLIDRYKQEITDMVETAFQEVNNP